MSRAVSYCCALCGDTAFTGHVREYEYPRGSGEVKQDVEGALLPGAGKCEVCGEYYCADCNELVDGVCPFCRDEAEPEDEDWEDYVPF